MANFADVSSAANFTIADAQKYFVSPLFLGNNGLDSMEVMTDIKGNTYLEHFSAARRITKADDGGAFSGQAGTVYTNPLIEPKRVEAEVFMKGQTFYNKVKGQVLRSGTDKDNVDGTLLKKIASEILMQGIVSDFNRQLWLNNTGITAGTLQADYNTYKGCFQSLEALPAAQKLTTEPAVDGAMTAQEARDILASMVKAAPAELKAIPKKFYVSGEIADLYEDYLTSKGNHIAYNDEQGGIPLLKFRGIELVVRRDWDVAVVEDNAVATACIVGNTANNGIYRAALIADKAMVVGTDYDSASVESWYNKDEKEYRFRFGYVCATILLDTKLAVSYISAETV
jgi:hypothetical protein